jgi:hypothetical protein
MFTGRIRHFFGVMVVIGAIIIYSTMGEKIGKRWKAVVEAAQGKPLSGSQPEVVNTEKPSSPPPSSIEPVVVSPSGKTMIFKGKTFVQIENSWLEKREDNTYQVNGVTTYFVDERAPTADEKDQSLNAEVNETEDLSVLERIASGQLSSYSPAEVALAMKKIKKAKSQIHERDILLEELSRSEK